MPRTLTHDGTDQPFFNPNDGRNADVSAAAFAAGIKKIGHNAYLYAGEIEEVSLS